VAEPFSLIDLIPDVATINIVDIGAMSLGSGSEPYASLLHANKARVVGFEPNPEECERLNEQHGEPHRFYPYFIGDGADATFYETNWAATGSLYPPNRALLEKFQNLHELTVLRKTHPVKTRRLDDIGDLGDVDFIKIDVQGSEFNVFKGAAKALASATLIQTEVEFVPLYVDQPLFADVDGVLRAAGYQFHTFNGFGMRCFKPLLVGQDKNRGLRQFLWSDAIYVRDFLKLDALKPEKLAKLAVLLHNLVRSFDLCLVVLTEIDRRDGGSLAAAYTERLVALDTA
jgi:FkbM family methyltransferase